MLIAATVSKRTYISYGFLALPLALVAITFYVYLHKYYSDVIGVSLSTIGWVVIISRIWDALIDPAMGLISDKSRTSLGRRRPWILAGTLPLVVSLFLVMNPSMNSFGVSHSLWFALWTFLFFLFWTVVNVPYEALGAELSFDYHERTKILGFRDAALVLGTLFAAVLPYAYDQLVENPAEENKFFFLSLVYSGLLVLGVLLCVFNVEEKTSSEQLRSNESFWESVSGVLSNRPFRILLVAYTIGAFGAMLPATLILYYVEYVLGSNQETANLFLVLYFLVGFLCLPLWIWVSKRIGKKESWILAMLINTGAFVGVYFLGAGDVLFYGILVALSATGYGATLALPSSMQADVIDYDELHSGLRKEGQFIGFWSVAKKLSAALGAGIAFPILAGAGYVPNIAQSEHTLFVLRFLYAGVPCICNFLAIIIALRYPITEEMHADIRAQIDKRSESKAI